MSKDIRVKVKDDVEQDVVVELPNGSEVTLQYRNYEDSPSVDILFRKPCVAYNWIGSSMTPAKAVEGAHVRLVDQIAVML